MNIIVVAGNKDKGKTRKIMRKFGFKVFSTNLWKAPELIKECARFAAEQNDMFIELMVSTESSIDDFNEIKRQVGDVKVRIHIPHCTMGFDAANRDWEKENRRTFAHSQRAADIFNAETMVVHAGCGRGQKYLEETVRQFKLFNDKRIVVENLLYSGEDGIARLGNTAEEIAYIMRESGCGFCFDFSHAICAALSLNTDIEEQLRSFYALKPTVYHLCDGDITRAKDLHLHFGQGNFPLKHYLRDYTAENAYITMETGEFTHHNDLWIKDYRYLKSLLAED